MGRPTAIIFDLYETLISEFQPVWRPLSSVSEQLGIEERAFAQAWQAQRERRMRGVIADHRRALSEICLQFGRVLDRTVIEALYQERLAHKAWWFARIDESILTVIRALKTRAVKLGVLTNATEEEVAAWPTCALAPYFDDIVVSCRVGLVKPERAIYELACDRLGVSPQMALFIGDGGGDELTGAAAAGLTPLWARWFLEQWPASKRSRELRQRAALFPSLYSPNECLAFITEWEQRNRDKQLA